MDRLLLFPSLIRETCHPDNGNRQQQDKRAKAQAQPMATTSLDIHVIPPRAAGAQSLTPPSTEHATLLIAGNEALPETVPLLKHTLAFRCVAINEERDSRVISYEGDQAHLLRRLSESNRFLEALSG
jgi:hypothetical protein